MAAVAELIRTEADGKISFGNHLLQEKSKKEGFEAGGDEYKVKTFKEITKLERNGMFVYESVPGTSVEHFAESENGVSFTVEGTEDAQITLNAKRPAGRNSPAGRFFHSDLLCLELSASSRASSAAFAVGT